jgi:tRNA(Phe) wybutosine-synthesizing methylase Tyw3
MQKQNKTPEEMKSSSKLNTKVIYDKNFEKIRSQQEIMTDASRKSSIDHHIKDLIESINSSENYFTTSSCSGRFLAFSQVCFL